MKKMIFIRLFSFITFFCINVLFAQTQQDVVIPENEPFGDPNWNFRGRMNGNRVSETFENHGEIGYWNENRGGLDYSDWPKGSGHPYLHGVGVVVGASIIDINGNRLASVQANYREEVDRSPDLETIWGWHPIPGYLNFDRAPNPIPAMSNDPTSWPPEWPDHPDWKDENGNVEWNGRFGRGKMNAQLESYYVMDDAVDKEYAYYPDANDTNRGGLGLRVAVRLYQWVHPLAQDVIFGEFWVSNVGTQDLDSTGFGWWVDNGIGDTGQDNAIYDGVNDMAIGFDQEAVGNWGGPAGIVGYGFLESPGIPSDMIDNDDDGLIDERRDNDAGVWIENPLQGPGGTFIDETKFVEWYGRAPAPHWEGDEDQDWLGFSDDNNNSNYDIGESINNDVGSDGVGPGDFNYYQPDPDGTEGNGRPDQGEPNFGRVDKDESDQLGMTSFRMIDNPGHPNPQPNQFQPLWFSDDETWWGWLSSDEIVEDPLSNANLNMIFASGTFPLEAERTERFSMVLGRALGGRDDYDAIIDLKRTAQAIYNIDYQFAQPPTKPTLTAVAGDKKVTLLWDNLAESSEDPFLGKNVKDFSGYRIYKATDPNFNEVTIVTDDAGQAIIKAPLKIFDLEDGFSGSHPILLNGAPYDMGNESGLQYRYDDTNVLNGVTYYYAIAAFDSGAVLKGLGPTENTTVIEVNAIGEPIFIDKNCAVVVPRSPAAGYQPPGITGDISQIISGLGTGRILDIESVNDNEIKNNEKFRIEFFHDPDNINVDRLRSVWTSNYSVYKVVDDTLQIILNKAVWNQDTEGIGITMPFNGMVATIQNDTADYDIPHTGWVTEDGQVTSNARGGLLFDIRPDTAVLGNHIYPHSDIELRFTDEPVTEAVKDRGGRKWLRNLTVNFEAVAADTSILSISVIDEDSSDAFEIEKDAIVIHENISGKRKSYWVVQLRPDNEDGIFEQPGLGDIIRMVTFKQFVTGDYFEFETTAAKIDHEEAANTLKRKQIAVVPNPYIVSNPAEPGDPYLLGQERRIQFIHLPAKCNIRIFTLSGKLVNTIEVNNPIDDGHILWDLRNSNDLEVAPGIYVFHVRDDATDMEQIGRFAIIL